MKRGSWGIGGKASQQASSVGTYRCTACENEKTLLQVLFMGQEMWIMEGRSVEKGVEKGLKRVKKDYEKRIQIIIDIYNFLIEK